MRYDLELGRESTNREGLITILPAWPETRQAFHSRKPFAPGVIYQDPANDAATAASAGYLRDPGWPHAGSIEIVQGEDMNMRSRLQAATAP